MASAKTEPRPELARSPLPLAVATPAPKAAASAASQRAEEAPGLAASLVTRAMLFVLGPHNTIEYAKVLVYAFLAGFAERLVPDTLDRLTRGGKT